MSFILCIDATADGDPVSFRLGGIAESERQNVVADIAAFERGDLPMEGVLTLTGQKGSRSWRWADIKHMWIEAAR